MNRYTEILTTLKIGTAVMVRLDDGSDFATITRSEPWKLGHGEWVVKVEGISGGYLLSRIRLRQWPYGGISS